MKIFFDTNVLVSAFLTRGLCADLMRLVLAEHQLMTGEFVLKELRRLLSDKFEMPPKKITDITVFLSQQIIIPTPAKPIDISIRDPDDLWVLSEALSGVALSGVALSGVALSGVADCMVTGDDDLLVLSKVQNLAILNPRQLWSLLNNPSF